MTLEEIYLLIESKFEKILDGEPSIDGLDQQKVIDFFRQNPDPNDKQVENYADNIGVPAEELENKIYELISDLVNNKKKIHPEVDLTAESLDRQWVLRVGDNIIGYEFSKEAAVKTAKQSLPTYGEVSVSSPNGQMYTVDQSGKWTLNKSLAEDLVSGGVADDDPDDNYDPEQLRVGMKHETEHTKDIRVAKEIAKDHLREDPDYYKKLKKYGIDEKRNTKMKGKNLGNTIQEAAVKAIQEFCSAKKKSLKEMFDMERDEKQPLAVEEEKEQTLQEVHSNRANRIGGLLLEKLGIKKNFLNEQNESAEMADYTGKFKPEEKELFFRWNAEQEGDPMYKLATLCADEDDPNSQGTRVVIGKDDALEVARSLESAETAMKPQEAQMAERVINILRRGAGERPLMSLKKVARRLKEEENSGELVNIKDLLGSDEMTVVKYVFKDNSAALKYVISGSVKPQHISKIVRAIKHHMGDMDPGEYWVAERLVDELEARSGVMTSAPEEEDIKEDVNQGENGLARAKEIVGNIIKSLQSGDELLSDWPEIQDAYQVAVGAKNEVAAEYIETAIELSNGHGKVDNECMKYLKAAYRML